MIHNVSSKTLILLLIVKLKWIMITVTMQIKVCLFGQKSNYSLYIKDPVSMLINLNESEIPLFQHI